MTGRIDLRPRISLQELRPAWPKPFGFIPYHPVHLRFEPRQRACGTSFERPELARAAQ